MANKELKQWITSKLNDPVWGSHQEVKLFDTKKKADWAYFYPNGKAILIEDKEKNDVSIDDAIKQLNEYEKICRKNNYNDIIKIGIKDIDTNKIIKVYRNDKYIDNVLKTIGYYEEMLGARKINDISDEIFKYTSKINQILQDEFNILVLKHRMLFTGCILVATKFENGNFGNYGGIDAFKQLVANKITSMFSHQERKALKINDLTKNFLSISIGKKPSNATIEKICDICNKINQLLKENPHSDIDIMNIFFTEFNRYRGKSQSGQVFTPDHIADLMAKLLNIKPTDKILDPTCGSGSLLLKSAKYNNLNWDNIFGNDDDINVLVLSYINMLLHNDGITNLVQMNAILDDDFTKWVKKNKITKVIANPPYENTFAIDILENVLDNVENGCRIVWLMPNNKLDKKCNKKRKIKLLSKNTLSDIILLPDIFPKTGCGEVSLFIFEKGKPQNGQKIKCWSILDDGFVTVKNQGYKDVYNKWPKIKQDFLEKFDKGEFDREIDPNDGFLSYPKDVCVIPLTKNDFALTLFQYELFNNEKIEKYSLLKKFMELNNKENKIEFLKTSLDFAQNNFYEQFIGALPKLKDLDTTSWKKIEIKKVLTRQTIKSISSTIRQYYDGDIKVIGNTSLNNGIKNYLNIKDPKYIHDGNSLSYGAKGGLFFYQKDKWASTDHVHMFTSKKLNEKNALFLCTVLNNLVKSFGGWNSSLESKIINYKISLPLTDDNEPDWEFMEKYMSNEK